MERENKDNKRKEGTTVGVDRKLNRTILHRTLFLLVTFGLLTFIPLFFRLWTIQIRDHELYQGKAISQQTRDNAVSANRGKILDVNGNVLASSGTVYDVILSPGDFKAVQENWDKKFKDDKGNILTEKRGYYPRPEADTVAAALAEILEVDYERLRAYFEKNTKYEQLTTRVEREVAQEIWQLISDMHLSNSVYTTPTTKRYYSYGSLASQVIGWVNPNLDNTGAYGMESMYEEELAGETGRVVTAKKGDGTEMKYSFQDYYDATDGNDLHLTIDTSIQYYCERILEKGVEMFDVQNGGFVIAMDPKTGAILAWANSPTYDLNDPWTVSDPVLAEYLETVRTELAEKGELTEEDKKKAYNTALGNAQNKQWRNKAISDSYEPGSTFKSIVLSIALEEGVVSEASTFYCPGYYVVDGSRISCWQKDGRHGTQTLTQAVQNSCNPAFMQIGQAVGAETFYDYLVNYGLLEPTGIDMQGESTRGPVPNLTWPRSTFAAGTTDQNTYLATASFGQGLQITPIQLITAISAVVNGGHLMQPYVMDSITDAEGNVVLQTEPTEVRQVISEETSERCRAILEKVVDGGTGKRAYVPGYRVGGKTGSSETLESRRGEDRTIVSFVGFAPADDPQIVTLVAFDKPQPVSKGSNYTANGYYISGGNMAGMLTGELMEDILEYMGVERVYTEEQQAFIDVTVPNVVGQVSSVGIDAAKSAGFTVRTVGEGDTVTGQIPVGGAVIPSGSQVVLYLGEEKPADQVAIPSLWGKTAAQAQEILEKYGLYLRVSGSSRYMSATATVASQSLAWGTLVERGTVVECQFSDNSMIE